MRRSSVFTTSTFITDKISMLKIPMMYLNINGMFRENPYTWYKGFGFEEWENGKPVRSYCGYYDGDKLVFVRVYVGINSTVYGINDAGVLVRGYYTEYHKSIVVETHKKYYDVYSKYGYGKN